MNQLTHELICGGWIPRRIKHHNSGPQVQFARLPDKKPNQKFLSWDLDLAPATKLIRLADIDVSSLPSSNVTGQIFHMSHVGSTAAAEMFRARRDCLVLSEPEAIGDVFFEPYNTSNSVKRDRVNTLLALFSATLGPHQPVIIKWPSWHALHVNFFINLLPQSSVCFMVRDPIEVLVALTRSPPQWMIRNRTVKRIKKERQQGCNLIESAIKSAFLDSMDFESPEAFPVFLSKYLRRLCEAIAASRTSVSVIDYRDLQTSIPDRLAREFGLASSAELTKRMLSVLNHDAKSRQVKTRFSSDVEKKHIQATPLIKQAASDLVSPALSRLTSRHCVN